AMQAGLERAQEDFARDGFCISIGEWDSTVAAVAVRIYSPTREIEAVMAGGIPSRFMTEMRLRQMAGPAFVHAAARISETMGLTGAAERGAA
ncbi:MAG: hypothetical protein O3A38_07130, partial [Proteobacteria bacterium]|nr:hypothetical protein [Pseudomonadota bacterium]